MSFKNILAALVVAALPAGAWAGYSASSFKREVKRGNNFWNANAALDSRPETCWMVDPEDQNEGQWIQLDLPSAEVDKLALIVGWDKAENEFFDYARIKRARLDVFSLIDGTPKQVLEHEVSFADKRGWQIVDVPDTRIGGEIYGGQVRLTVLETYAGKDYPNLAVSEVRIHLKEWEADTLDVSSGPDSEADGHAGALMMDMNDKTFWAATSQSASFELTAPGFGLASIGIKSGPKAYARPKTLEVTVNDITQTFVIADKEEIQFNLLPVVVGYTGSSWGTVKVKIIDSYPGEAGKGVAISEVKLHAATIEDL